MLKRNFTAYFCEPLL